MPRDGYPSIIFVADVALTELAAALGGCLGTPHITLYHWSAPKNADGRDADPMIVDVGSFDLAAPFVRAGIVHHEAGDTKLHIDIDYDLMAPPPMAAFAAALARKLDAPVIYDAGDISPYAYRRAWPDGRDDAVFVEQGENDLIFHVRDDPHAGKAR